MKGANANLNLCKVTGAAAAARMRMGAFYTTHQKVRLGLWPSEYLEFCPCCNENVKEDLGHILRDCAKWEDLREEVKDILDAADSVARGDRDLANAILLGGGKNVLSKAE